MNNSHFTIISRAFARRRLIGLTSLVVFAFTAKLALAQTSPLYVTDGQDQEIFEFQHGALVKFWTAPNSSEYPIAISSVTIRTTGASSGAVGSVYDLGGTFNGTVTTAPTSGFNFYDGTSDGTFNYAVEYNTGNVYRFNLDWSNPSFIFATSHPNEIGITYDRSTNSLWTNGFFDGVVRHWTLGGTALSGGFSTGLSSAASLARDPVDGTFWLTAQTNPGVLYQYDSAGNQLSQVFDSAATNANFLGAEFAPNLSTFKINTLTANNASAIDAATRMTDDRAGIAVSRSKAFLVGDGNGSTCCNGGFVTANRSDLSSPTASSTNRDGLVMDIHSQIIYTLANSGTPVPSGTACAPSTFTVNQLIRLDPDTAATTATVINLSAPITIGTNSCSSGQAAVFSGYDRIVLVSNNGAAYNIDLPSGLVSQIGVINSPDFINRSFSENWATWGVAEFFDGAVHITYPAGGYPVTQVLRTNVSDNTTSVLVDFSPQDLSDNHEFTVVPTLNRWYFHYEGCGNNAIVCAGNENLGFADATFTITGSTLWGSAFQGSTGAASLYMIDQNTGLATLIGPIGFNRVGAIDFDPVNGILYGTGRRTSDSSYVTISIDLATGAGTEIGINTRNFEDISFRSDGTLFGYSSGSIFTLDTNNGSASLVGSTGAGFPDGNGLAFSPTGTLYSINQGDEVTIDPSTGTATHVTNMSYPNPPLNNGPRANGMDFDITTGILWAAVANNFSSSVTNYLTTITPANGHVTVIGQTVTGLDALAVQTSSFLISVSADPPSGGTVNGGGNYPAGTTATVIATANNCYQFVNWTENGNEVSTSASYSFTVTSARTLVANFTKIQYNISANASPSAGGSVGGGGTFDCGSTVNLTAAPANACYQFVNWTEGANVVSTSANYSFTASADRTLVANFTKTDASAPAITTPENLIVHAQKKKVNGQKGAFVNFTVTAVDPDDGSVPAFASPPSGSFFPVGTTTVNVTSTDDCGNTGTASFTITVKKR